VRRALAVLALVAAAVAATGCCETTSRTYVIDAPDPDLMAALQACADTQPCYENGKYCISTECRAACRRVVQLAGDATGDELDHCSVTLAMDGGTGAQVSLTFKTCGL
jgi:hypothetical protein